MKDEYALSELQLANLDAKLAYLIEAASRLGRKDWLNAFIGAMLGFLVLSVPPDASRYIWVLFLSSITHLFGLGLPGLGNG